MYYCSIVQEDWRSAIGVLSRGLATGEPPGELVEPEKQEAAEAQPQETAAAQELVTAAAQDMRSAVAQEPVTAAAQARRIAAV